MRDVSSLILHYVILLLFLLGAVRSNVDKVRLRVSVRKDSLEKVPSCQHSLSQVGTMSTMGGHNIGTQRKAVSSSHSAAHPESLLDLL